MHVILLTLWELTRYFPFEKQCNSTEKSMQHSNLCDPPPGRLPEQVRRSGQEQLCTNQRGIQGLWQAKKKRSNIGNEC
ncbi:hypothetical protein AAES_26826 [Amazona aestiva]|uniref:Uncharacterized protein n=1 Tax=Amazona aestiva TaxID=12930 RepID=A0A0Q3X7W9_AMAAE|nr:hypothetical protein AAES_26826 [Amazona aestiva]